MANRPPEHPSITAYREFLAKLLDDVVNKPVFDLSYLAIDEREVWPWGDKILWDDEPYEDGSGALIAAVRYQKMGWNP